MGEFRMSRRDQELREANFRNADEAFLLLQLIDSEFRSDPMSVQCFDLQLVERVRQCVATRAKYEKEYSYA